MLRHWQESDNCKLRMHYYLGKFTLLVCLVVTKMLIGVLASEHEHLREQAMVVITLINL